MARKKEPFPVRKDSHTQHKWAAAAACFGTTNFLAAWGGIAPCTNERQVSWLKDRRARPSSRFPSDVVAAHSPFTVTSSRRSLTCFPFTPCPAQRARRSGTDHFLYSLLFHCAYYSRRMGKIQPPFYKSMHGCRIDNSLFVHYNGTTTS